MKIKHIQWVIIGFVVICAMLMLYFNQNPKAYIRPSQLTSVSEGNVFSFKSLNNSKVINVQIVGTETKYTAQELKTKLMAADGIQLETPKNSPFDKQKRVRAYVYLNGQPLK